MVRSVCELWIRIIPICYVLSYFTYFLFPNFDFFVTSPVKKPEDRTQEKLNVEQKIHEDTSRTKEQMNARCKNREQ